MAKLPAQIMATNPKLTSMPNARPPAAKAMLVLASALLSKIPITPQRTVSFCAVPATASCATLTAAAWISAKPTTQAATKVPLSPNH